MMIEPKLNVWPGGWRGTLGSNLISTIRNILTLAAGYYSQYS